MMEEAEVEHDLPTSLPPKTLKGGAGGADASDSEDEAAPDFSALAALAKRRRLEHDDSVADETIGGSSGTGMPIIPKRGEKDFEPTGFAGQNKALDNSRAAMFEVISGERIINSKSIAVAVWEPLLQRAIVQLTRGQVFSSMGVSHRVAVLEDGQFEDLAKLRNAKQHGELAPIAGTTKEGVFWPKMQSRLELLPEEALYLIERGSLECRVNVDNAKPAVKADDLTMREYDDEDESQSTAEWVPLSVEQAYAAMIGADGLTRPQYQLYAHLRRLGYIVQRKSVFEAQRANASKSSTKQATSKDAFESKGIISDPRHPLRLVTIFDVLLYPFRRIAQLSAQALTHLGGVILPRVVDWFRRLIGRITSLAAITSRATTLKRRPGLLGIGSTTWSSYDEIYDRLRIVPTGHDVPFKRSKQDDAPEIFFYAWRPATLFKKSDPPLPEYQIAVVDARSTSLPSAFAFADVFQRIPMPLSSDDWALMDEDEQRAFKVAEEQRKRNDESYGRGAVRKREAALKSKAGASKQQEVQKEGKLTNVSIWHRLVHFFAFLRSLLPFIQSGSKRKTGGGRSLSGGRPNHPTNVYVPLKAGRRNVIVAVNDCGTTSLLRFGEAEFARWRIAGTQREGR